MNTVCECFLIDRRYTIRDSIFFIPLFKGIEDQAMFFFIDQHIII